MKPFISARVPRAALVLSLAVVAAGVLIAQEQNSRPLRERTLFNENFGSFRVALTPAVLKVLLETTRAQQGLKDAKPSQRKNPARLFRAAESHLYAHDEIDLVVMGIFPMSGADNTWFWVVRSAQKDPRVVLFAGGNSIQMLTRRTNGYRDIRCDWSSAAITTIDIYKFDGTEYRLRSSKATNNGTGETLTKQF